MALAKTCCLANPVREVQERSDVMSISTVKEYDLAKWHSVASAVQPEVRLFIDGEYVDAIEGGRFETVNPALRRHETIGERQGQVLR